MKPLVCVAEQGRGDGGGACTRCQTPAGQGCGGIGPDAWAREALTAPDGLVTVFHPIVGAADGRVAGYEALIRARDPRGGDGFIGAGPLIEACERLQLQHVLDQRARQTAIRNAAALDAPATVRFFINFLPNTIYDPEICLRTTMEAAAEYGLPLSRLVFEVVETEKIPDIKRLRRILDYYRSRGAGTAVDDLGAGFSSLQYVTELLPDYVKIDREIVRAAVEDDIARARLTMMVAASHEAGAKVIAEGIETPEQLSLCRELRVDLVQGFLLARPALPPESVPASLFGTVTLSPGTTATAVNASGRAARRGATTVGGVAVRL